jgi:hypothetical protein
MRSSRVVHPSSDCSTALSWIFTRNGLNLMCGVALSSGANSVSAVPLWDPQAASVETFTSPVAAFSRHAELSQLLRESGWVVTDRSRSRSRARAA